MSCHCVSRDCVGVRRWQNRKPFQPPVNPFAEASQKVLRERIKEARKMEDAGVMRRLVRVARKLVAGVTLVRVS